VAHRRYNGLINTDKIFPKHHEAIALAFEASWSRRIRFLSKPPAKPHMLPVFSHDPMARYDDGYGISASCRPRGPHGRRRACPTGQVGIADRLAIRDSGNLVPDSLLKFRSHLIDSGREKVVRLPLKYSSSCFAALRKTGCAVLSTHPLLAGTCFRPRNKARSAPRRRRQQQLPEGALHLQVAHHAGWLRCHWRFVVPCFHHVMRNLATSRARCSPLSVIK
jgi:hypothetical protein